MAKRSSFPKVFWVANTTEILERFAYYGIYMGFGIYMQHLGYTKGQLGFIQSLFLLFSYTIPVISGTLADRYGFKKMLIVSYLAYLPSILLLIFTKSFSGIALTMLTIGLAAGIFKPLISGTVRVVTDKTNKTLGFGIFYAMVNIGGTFGPVVAGNLRAISWNYAFAASAISIGFMFLLTLFFYKEPPRQMEGVTLKQKITDLGIALSDVKFLVFLILLGLFFWLPLWSFYNILAIYIDNNLDTASLYITLKWLLGSTIAGFISNVDTHGVRKIMGETIASAGLYIIFFQLLVSRITEKGKAIPVFSSGLFIAALGFVMLAFSVYFNPAFVFLGIILFAVGEMASSPRIQEYITWIAPKEKAGLYMGSNFLATGIGGTLSGITYTSLYGWFNDHGHPEYIWFTLAAHCVVGVGVFYLFSRFLGEFKEMTE
jgi:proton-dependent oligopeptide transporter, POT family